MEASQSDAEVEVYSDSDGGPEDYSDDQDYESSSDDESDQSEMDKETPHPKRLRVTAPDGPSNPVPASPLPPVVQVGRGPKRLELNHAPMVFDCHDCGLRNVISVVRCRYCRSSMKLMYCQDCMSNH